MRYPEDLFKVQRYQLARYHVTDAERLLREQRPVGGRRGPGDDRQAAAAVPPVGARPQRLGDEPVFSLTSVYAPYRRDNLASFVSVDADASERGLRDAAGAPLPGNTQIPGPGQIANQFGSDDDDPERAGQADPATPTCRCSTATCSRCRWV